MSIVVIVNQTLPKELSHCHDDREALAWALEHREHVTIFLDNDNTSIYDNRIPDEDERFDERYRMDAFMGDGVGTNVLLELLGFEVENA